MKKSGNLLLILALNGLVTYLIYPEVTDVITKPNAREIYERDFSLDNKKYVVWKNLANQATKDSLSISLPQTINGVFSTERNEIFSFDFEAKEGHQFIAEVTTQIDSAKVFIELLQYLNDSIASLTSIEQNKPNTLKIYEAISQNARYKIIIQPELFVDTSFDIKMYTKPLYSFPVTGASNKDIQSFWGAFREGGKRSHKGNDIFAFRGTPVVAVTNGVISSTGNRGLGGKQVWLRDKIIGGNTLYYAHLDSIIATTGQFVSVRDTLGLVGNTGNARTTPPHLHFGIYQGSKGAIDPLPFIKIAEEPTSRKSFNFTKAVAKRNSGALKKAPSKASETLFTFNKQDTISIFGTMGNYLHVSAADSIRGFIKTSEMRLLSPN